MQIEVVKWEEYNPRREKNLKSMHWFRLQTDLPFNPKMFELSINAKWVFICLLCTCAKKVTNIVEVSDNYLSHISGVAIKEIPNIINSLQSCGLICTKFVPDLTEIVPLHNNTIHNSTEQREDIMSGKEPDPSPLILNYLNSKANTAYRAIDTNLLPIKARVQDLTRKPIKEHPEFNPQKWCEAVIDERIRLWGNDPKMRMYIRPVTIFAKTNFHKYLDEILTEFKRGA